MNCFNFHHKCKAECCSTLTPLPIDVVERNESKIINQHSEKHEAEGNCILVTDNHRCVFLKEDNTCNIYDERPDVCRKFGDESHPLLFCTIQSKEGKARSRQEKRKVERMIDKFTDRFNAFASRIK